MGDTPGMNQHDARGRSPHRAKRTSPVGAQTCTRAHVQAVFLRIGRGKRDIPQAFPPDQAARDIKKQRRRGVQGR